MAWIYLAESEGSHSHSENGLDQSPTVKTTSTLKLCSCRGWLMAESQDVQSGMTLHRSEAPCYQVSISSTEDSPVRISVLPDLERAWAESEVNFSSKLSDSQRKLERRLCSSKTSPRLELADFDRSSEHLPSSGMIVGGRLFLPKKLAPRTSEKDGSLLPTPAANSYGTNQGGAAGRTGKIRASLETMTRRNLWPTPTVRDSGTIAQVTRGKNAQPGGTPLPVAVGGTLNPTWVEWLMGYPLEWTVLGDWATQWFRSKLK